MKFSTTMLQIGNNTGIEVPADVIEVLGRRQDAYLVGFSRHARSNGSRHALGAINWWMAFGPQVPS